MTVTGSHDGVIIRFADEVYELSREDASSLQEAIGDALTERREFFRTVGEHREDGTYEVSRRSADSSGNAKVFDTFEAIRRLYTRLPAEFTAEDVGRTGITGSRRHMLVRHFAEHPAFHCEITSRNPLTVVKREGPAVESGELSEAAGD